MAKKLTLAQRRMLIARPDTADFRDRLYVPTLVEVPLYISLDVFRARKIPILDQGKEGACTGFGLATVANYLLNTREILPDPNPVSARMLYEMARRYDEWRGENYDGSSARGAMKGWHKHGVCADAIWPYSDKKTKASEQLTDLRARDAVARPLGAYFRVNHKDIVSMHAALAETGILFATSLVHDGWDAVTKKGIIKFEEGCVGGHAFAIVAYDIDGFWIQNSWGPGWGMDGFARISYDDWLKNGTDAWVARLGAPINLLSYEGVARSRSAAAGTRTGYSQAELRSHIISIGNEGLLRPTGDFGTSEADVDEIIGNDFPNITTNWSRKRIVLYAHGGLVPENSAVQRVAEYRKTLLEHEVYPLSFIWKSDYWTTLRNMLRDAISGIRSEGFLGDTLDFVLDRTDDAIEPIARRLTGKAAWDEMKENAELATTNPKGGARYAIKQLAKVIKSDPTVEVHVVGHSAGSIFNGPLVQLLANNGIKIKTCTLWAPAINMKQFHKFYVPAIKNKSIERFALFTLTDKAERDDNCAGIYNKSLLYLVAHAFEEKPRIPIIRPDGTPILGMAKFIETDAVLSQLIQKGRIDWVQSPNAAPSTSTDQSKAAHHGDFDNDESTVTATLLRILRSSSTPARGAKPKTMGAKLKPKGPKPKVSGTSMPFTFTRSASGLGDRRRRILN